MTDEKPDAKPNEKLRAPRNRTLTLSTEEIQRYTQRLLKLEGAIAPPDLQNKTISQDLFKILDWLPTQFVDLLFIDPPYNLTKSFGTERFRERSLAAYQTWLESWLPKLLRILKPTASVYICGDWRSSAAIQLVAEQYLTIRNCITWEREKGRGAKANWKNCSEQIWFCTVSEQYTFNLEAVKLRRKVIAPYTDATGSPKDWEKTENGNYRLTHPSNLWTDLSIPFWSMPENTDHPTQKPEKLLAKIILASSNLNDWVFDPFLGSGTTSVVAKKTGRNYVGVELDPLYGCMAEKRLAIADQNKTIQGYAEGVFWERNSIKD
ncbi:MAG: site-specific DNA-methyltransferase [Drouetiella hepatica Uher 2000/2452]|jgi:site-specific DNA-methyltransferase (adenine-specific)|uniref:Methyltransferase n=1 Tax=Drouetiella hepatica Uher 2000/2452 TaxID=904376 RepID=A0A951Q9T6_9CYAN|nr:site-specific DNA-methyltransferase [Drouetiella hepatica Uher 2000/2452]